MTSKILIVSILLILSLLFSGCIEEKEEPEFHYPTPDYEQLQNQLKNATEILEERYPQITKEKVVKRWNVDVDAYENYDPYPKPLYLEFRNNDTYYLSIPGQYDVGYYVIENNTISLYCDSAFNSSPHQLYAYGHFDSEETMKLTIYMGNWSTMYLY